MAKRKTVKGEDYGDFYENLAALAEEKGIDSEIDRKSTRLNSSHPE